MGNRQQHIPGTLCRDRTLELSNVDLSREFTSRIVAQRGFRAWEREEIRADTPGDGGKRRWMGAGPRGGASVSVVRDAAAPAEAAST